jgi:hypothetical protein
MDMPGGALAWHGLVLLVRHCDVGALLWLLRW